MKLLTYVVLLTLAVFSISKKIYNDIEGCGGQYNEQPTIKLEPKLVSTTTNGKRFLIEDGDNVVNFLNVTGTPYEMGYASGKLMAKEIRENLDGMLNYVLESGADMLKEYNVPTFIIKQLRKTATNLGLYLLNLNWELAEPFIPERFPEEMQGMADGSGVEYETIRAWNMFPELIKASCTILGAWKNSTVENKLLTLRALDWDSDAPINRNPLITVYHSSEEGSYPFSNIGYAGLIGSLTAGGSQGVSIAEKVWLPRDTTGNPTTYKGKPWMFVLRDLAEFELTIEDLANSIANSNRTCRIHVGIASAESNAFEGVDYSWQVLDFFNDQNYTDYTEAHPQFDGIMYFDKHVQPSSDACIGNIIKDTWGQITWETLFREVGGMHKTGDTQLCVIDVFENQIYLSYSAYETNEKAYLRSPMQIDLKPFYGITGSLQKKL